MQNSVIRWQPELIQRHNKFWITVPDFFQRSVFSCNGRLAVHLIGSLDVNARVVPDCDKINLAPIQFPDYTS